MDKNREQKKTPLRKLVNILVANEIFPNQNVFYNCVFRMDITDNNDKSILKNSYYSNSLLKEIKESLSAANTKGAPIIDYDHPDNNAFVKKFYQFATGNFEVELEPDCLFIGKSSENAANIANYINGKRSIEKKWIERFGDQTDRSVIRRYFCEPLSLIMQYLISLDVSKSNRLIIKNDISKIKETNPWESYIEFFSLQDSVQEKIKKELKGEDIYPYDILKAESNLTILNIAYVIYAAINEQSSNGDKNLQRVVKSEKAPLKQRTLVDDYEFYVNYVNCYGYKTTDRFNMLRKYAESNVYCANELGAIYYYGDKFYAVNDELIIEQDFDKAVEFYSLCIEEPLIVNNACWSLGYMALHGKYPLIDAMDIDRYQWASDLFRRCSPDYAPAMNSLGLVELYYANDLRKNRTKSELDDSELKQVLRHYEEFIKYTYKAAQKGLVNGYNAIAGFLLRKENEEFIPLIRAISANNIELIPMLEASANMDNVWALDQLANVYYRGETNESKMTRLVKARQLLERAHNQGYAWSAYHLAIYFFKNDTEKYWELITEAAQKGCNEAIEILDSK